MALNLTLILPSTPVVANQNETYQIRIQNTGGTDVAISAIAVYVAPAATSCMLAQPSLPPGTSLTVAAGATNFYTGSVCFIAPFISGGPAVPQSIFQLGATVFSNDATAPVQQVPPLSVAVAPQINWTQGQNPTTPGWLDFGQSANSGLLGLGIY